MKLIRNAIQFALILIGIAFFSASVFAMPIQLYYQGKLTDDQNVPISGTLKMTFKIYVDNVLKWSEVYDGSQKVSVVFGQFSVKLGSVSALDPDIFKGNSVQLGITVGSDSEMSPRVELLGTPFAFQAYNSTLFNGYQSSDFLIVTSNNTIPGTMSFNGSSRQVISMSSSQYGIGFQPMTHYFRTEGDFAFYVGGVHSNVALDPGEGGIVPMVIKSTGKVGINDTNPQEALSVGGNLFLSGDASIQGFVTVNTGLNAPQLNSEILNVTTINLPSSVSRQAIQLGGSNYGLGLQTDTQYFRTAGDFAFYSGGSHSNTALNPGSGGTVPMVIKKTGNVGIGTLVPSSSLHVMGVITATGVSINNGITVNELLVNSKIVSDKILNKQGQSYATVNSVVVNKIPFFDSSNGLKPALGLEWDGSQLKAFSAESITVNLGINAQAITANRIRSSLFSGIGLELVNIPMEGVTNLIASLNALRTSIDATNQSQWTTNASGIYYSSGNVGIKTSAPSAELDIVGSAKISQTVTANLFVGNGSGLTNVNAIKIQGKSISTTAPSTGQVLKWDGGLQQWVPDVDNTSTAISNGQTGQVGVFGGSGGSSTIVTSFTSFQYVSSTNTLVLNGTASTNYLTVSETATINKSVLTVANVGSLIATDVSVNNNITANRIVGNGIYTMGNVGIGTLNPTTPLEVSGNIRASKIGIGTAVPSYDFHVIGNAYITGNVTANAFIGNGSQLSNITAVQIQGKNLATSLKTVGSAQDGYALKWNNTASQWEAQIDDTSTVTAAGSANQIGFFSAASALTGSPDLQWFSSSLRINGQVSANTGLISGVLTANSVNVVTGVFTGNVTSNSLVVSNQMSANTGLISGALTANSVNAATGAFTGNVTSNSLRVSTQVNSVTGVFTGNVTSNSLVVSNQVSANTGMISGTLTANSVNATTGLFTGNVTANTFYGSGQGLVSIPQSAITGLNTALSSIQSNISVINSSQWTTNVSGDVYFLSGKVGIGTTSPNAALQVSGGLISDVVTASILVTTNTLYANKVIVGDVTVNNLIVNTQVTADQLKNKQGNSYVTANNGVVNKVAFFNSTNGISGASGLEWDSGNNRVKAFSAEALIVNGTVTANKFVGNHVGDGSGLTNITMAGITNLVTSLNSLASSINATNQSQWTTTSSGDIYLLISKVGIGTTTPSSSLHVIGGMNADVVTVSNTITTNIAYANKGTFGDVTINNQLIVDQIKNKQGNSYVTANNAVINKIAFFNSGNGVSGASGLEWDFINNELNPFLAEALTVVGTVTANKFVGNGSLITGLLPSNLVSANALTGQVLSWNGSSWIPTVAVAQWITSSNATSVYYTGGNIGIGTTSPSSPLQVMGVMTADGVTVSGTVTANKFVGTHVGNGAALTGLLPSNLVSANATTGQVLSWNGSSWIPTVAVAQWITSSNSTSVYYTGGNIGIGTTSPSSILQVVGVMTADGVTVSGTVTANKIVATTLSGTGSGLTGIPMSGVTNLVTSLNAMQASINATNQSQWTTNPSGDIYITSGKVAVGNAIPSSSFHVTGIITADGVTVSGTVTANKFVGTHAGNGALLTGLLPSSLVSANATTGQVLSWNGSSWIPTVAVAQWITSSNSTSVYYTGGNIGIGTTSPSTPLHVVGVMTADGVTVNGGVTANRIIGSTLGIGTTAPKSKLHVVGDIRLEGTQMVTQNTVVVSGATTTIDWTVNNNTKVTISGTNTTLSFVAPTGPARLMLIIDHQGAGVMSFPTMKWSGGITPIFTNAAGSTDVMIIYYDGSTYYASAATDFR